jgi:hypothetical protein
MEIDSNESVKKDDDGFAKPIIAPKTFGLKLAKKTEMDEAVEKFSETKKTNSSVNNILFRRNKTRLIWKSLKYRRRS